MLHICNFCSEFPLGYTGSNQLCEVVTPHPCTTVQMTSVRFSVFLRQQHNTFHLEAAPLLLQHSSIAAKDYLLDTRSQAITASAEDL